MSNSYKEYNDYSEKDKLSLVIDKLDNVKVAVQNIPQGGGGGEPMMLGFEVTEDGTMQPTSAKKLEFSSEVKYVPQHSLQYYFSSNTYYGHRLHTSNIEEVVFPELVGYKDSSLHCTYAFYYAFSGNTNLKTVRFPKLKELYSHNCNNYFRSAFDSCSNLTTVEFPELESLSKADYVFQNAFNKCTSLKTLSFPKLRTVADASSCFEGMFRGCTALTDVYFNSLDTVLNGNYASNMLYGCTDVKVHFKSSLSGTISASIFGGNSIQVVYDL